MSFTNVELLVINQASILLNNGTVNDLDSNDEFVVSARAAFDFVIDSELAAYNWRFATTIAQLDLLVEKPELANFNFKLRLPADMLAIDLIFQTGGSGHVLFNYLIFEDNIIFANIKEVSTVYRRRGEINKFPAHFVRYLGYALADYLAIGVALNVQVVELVEKRLQAALANAAFVDTQNYPAQSIQDNPFLHDNFRNGAFNNQTIIIGG